MENIGIFSSSNRGMEWEYISIELNFKHALKKLEDAKNISNNLPDKIDAYHKTSLLIFFSKHFKNNTGKFS